MTRSTVTVARLVLAPSILLLAAWAVIPLAMTAWFSVHDNQLLLPSRGAYVGLENFRYMVTTPEVVAAIAHTITHALGVLAISVIGGTAFALLLDQPMMGRSVVRLIVLAPFFVMPAVSGLLWKNLLMNPVNGVLTWSLQAVGFDPVDWMGQWPLGSLTIVVGWSWLPFATVILLTALQSLDREQLEAAELDGAGPWARFVYVVLPHLRRPMVVVVLIETVFLLSLFAEILVTTNGGPGAASTNLAFLVYAQALLRFDVGAASAAGLIAVVVANVLAAGLMRLVGRGMEA
jgi:sorbitol/mannitol transport system permease protein